MTGWPTRCGSRTTCGSRVDGMATSETQTGTRVLDVLQFAVPWDAAVAIVGKEAEGTGRRLVLPLAPDGSREPDLSDTDAIARLDALRAEGCEFLVVGASAYPWLDARLALGAHLENRYRLVDRDPVACAVYALHEAPTHPHSDGLPLPPADMIRMTSGLQRRAGNAAAIYERYDQGGANSAGFIRDLLDRNAVDMSGIGTLLDFGCGCGRVVRQWAGLPAELHGSDYNPNLIRWCADNLPVATFAVNGAVPPLPYGDDSFDFLYSISIFTHLDAPLQLPWMNELVRVVRPGGLIMITVSGEVFASRLPRWDELREPFAAGDLIVRKPERAGSNACAAFHPEPYVRGTFTAGLEIVEHVQGVREVGFQDAVLLRTPER